MKTALLCAIVMVASLLIAVPVSAHHVAPSSCTPSGDQCVSARKVDGIRKLRIGLAGPYYQRYRLCVRAPGGTRSCKRFSIEKDGYFYGDSVRWARQFPRKGPGRYTVTWRHSGGVLAGRAGFHIRS